MLDRPTLDLGALDPGQRRELAVLLTEKERRGRLNKIDSFFPEEGPLRRELYPKHMEFFEAGATYRERCAMAANRVGKCISGHTEVDTPRGPVRAIDLRNGDEVFAWDGSAKVPRPILTPFRKAGLHECALIVMSDGRRVEAADHHRMLVGGEWTLLSQLLPQSFFGRQASSSASGPSVRAAGAERWTKTLQGWRDRCSASLRRGGAQLLFAAAAFPARAPRPAGALPRTSAPYGGQGSTGSGSPSAVSSRASTLDAFRQSAARFVGSLAQAACTPAAPNPLTRPGAWLRRAVAGAALRSMGAVATQALPFGPAKTSPWKTPNVDGNHIIAVIPIGRHKVYDFTVAGLHNYCAGGLVHHNTEGMGGYETALHLTGIYPPWWIGRRFDGPVRGWAGGKTNETTRDIVQAKLCGPISHHSGDKGVAGTGLIRGRCIGRPTWKQGVADLIDTLPVKHASGGWSQLGFKSYQQGRGSFEGTEQDFVWLDEEPPEDVYGECLIRTATTNGLVYITFTPLEGITGTVLSFMPGGAPGSEEDGVGERVL